MWRSHFWCLSHIYGRQLRFEGWQDTQINVQGELYDEISKCMSSIQGAVNVSVDMRWLIHLYRYVSLQALHPVHIHNGQSPVVGDRRVLPMHDSSNSNLAWTSTQEWVTQGKYGGDTKAVREAEGSTIDLVQIDAPKVQLSIHHIKLNISTYLVVSFVWILSRVSPLVPPLSPRTVLPILGLEVYLSSHFHFI
jgi:hypothetical protein